MRLLPVFVAVGFVTLIGILVWARTPPTIPCQVCEPCLSCPPDEHLNVLACDRELSRRVRLQDPLEKSLNKCLTALQSCADGIETRDSRLEADDNYEREIREKRDSAEEERDACLRKLDMLNPLSP